MQMLIWWQKKNLIKPQYTDAVSLEKKYQYIKLLVYINNGYYKI